MTLNLSNVTLDICEDMHVMHRDRTGRFHFKINRPKLKSPQAEVNYSVLVYISSLMIRLIQRAY
jgi:hypothetical protein